MRTASFADRMAGGAVSFVDGLGERVHGIDLDGCPIDVLWLRPEFAAVPTFEPALHERTARVSHFRDPAFARVRRIETASPEGGALAVVSERVDGRRLSALLSDAHAGRAQVTFDVGMDLVRQLVAAIARLHAHARDVAHGALAPERVIVNDRGELRIVEHVLGPSIEQLLWSRRRLWLDLRIAMPPTAGLLRFDQRADLTQVGATALAIVLGRPLLYEDHRDEFARVLREASDRVARANPSLATGFAGWLLRVLQIEGRSFGSAKEALAALEELLAPVSRRAPPRVVSFEPRVSSPAPGLRPPAFVFPELRAPTIEPRREAAWVAPPHVRHPAPLDERPSPVIDLVLEALGRWVPSWRVVIGITLALVAIGATIGGTVLYMKSGTTAPDARARRAAPTPPPATRPRERRPVAATAAPATPGVARPAAAAPAAAAPVGPAPAGAEITLNVDVVAEAPAAALEPGWLAIKAPVEMTIYERGVRLGDVREGHIALAPGAHEIEIVNETLRFRAMRRVEVQPAQETVLTINLPFGVIDLNATPWAEVWLDGRRLGETPIGGLAVPLGPHEFVFRHPAYGERRYAVSLTAGDPIRLSVDMTRR